MEKKQKLIILLIALSLVLVCTGLSFAFFTSISNNESASTIYAKGGRMSIVYANGSGNIVMENIYPKEEEWVNKTFTVTGTNTTELDMDYKIYLVIQSNAFNFGDLTYSISGSSTNSRDIIVQKSEQNIPKTGEILIGKGTFKNNNATHTYYLKIYYKDTGEDQNIGQGKSFTGYVKINTGSSIGYDTLVNIKDNNPQPESAAFNGTIARKQVESVTFKNNVTVPANAITSWDASDSQNGSVMAYTLDDNNNNLYELYIGQDEKVVLGKDAFKLFKGYNKATTLDVSNLDTSNVINMSRMFEDSTITQIKGLDKWDTSKVTDMSYMFLNTNNLLSLDLSKFNTSNVKFMNGMFEKAKSLKTLDLSNFDTSKVEHMGTWNYSYGGMFQDCSSLTSINLSSFNTSNVTTMGNMFKGCSSLTTLDLSNFDTSKVEYMPNMFRECSSLTNLNISRFNTSNVKYMGSMFHSVASSELDLSHFDTHNVLDMSFMFYNSAATSLNLSSFDTSNVTNMQGMFSGSHATSLNLSSFNTSKVTNMYSMFYKSAATSLNLSSFNTSNVTNMSSMFYKSAATSLNLSSFNTSNVTNMQSMFNGSHATSLNLSSFNTSKVTNMGYMFFNSPATTLDLSSFDTSSVKDTDLMFSASKATIGYARTQADADKLNSSSYKPAILTFTVKS